MTLRRPFVNNSGLSEMPSGQAVPVDTLLVPWRPRRSGVYQPNMIDCTLASSTATNNQRHYAPFDVFEDMTFDRWALWITTQGVGGTQTASISIWSASATTNLPIGSDTLGLITAAPTIDLTAVPGFTESATFASPFTIPSGRYWLGIRFVISGVTTAAVIGSGAKHDSRISSTSVANVTFTSGFRQTSVTSNTQAVGTLLSSYAPATWFRRT